MLTFATQMQLFGSFISTLLLFIYCTGFVHGLTPRCNHYSVVEHVANTDGEHHHEHHEHDGVATEDHDHVEHNGHLDAGAFDLLICLLEDVSHSDLPSDGCHCVPTMTNRTASDWTAKLRMLAVVVPFVIFPETSTETTFYCATSSVIPSSPLLSGLPQRGPPSIS
jgi:hypothetical protein